jgi:hypothetical protein
VSLNGVEKRPGGKLSAANGYDGPYVPTCQEIKQQKCKNGRSAENWFLRASINLGQRFRAAAFRLAAPLSACSFLHAVIVSFA